MAKGDLRKNLKLALGIVERSSNVDTGINPLSFDQFLQYFQYQGLNYPFIPQTTMGQTPTEEIGANFLGLINGAYKSNGVVFACSMVRMLCFAEARFQWQNMSGGRPGDLFGTKALAPLEEPGQNKTTGDMLSRAIQDVDLAGNWYAVRNGAGVRRLRPDWVVVMAGSKRGSTDELELIGYVYQPGGPGSGLDVETFLAEEVAHFAPYPDPAQKFIGMSWVIPVIREVMGDQAAATHKVKFFENGATPNLIISLDPTVSQNAFREWIEAFDEDHKGMLNAYRTMYLGGGAQAQVVGSQLRQMDFANTQGHGETRIAAAAGVPPVIVGLSEGLAAATYSNYGQAVRRFADGTLRPLWRNMAGSLTPLVTVPNSNARLWYDDRDIPFLAGDRTDEADVQTKEAATISTLVQAGYEPESVILAVQNGDWSRLQHSGLVSVQMQPIEGAPPEPSDNGVAPSSNGGSADVPALPPGPPQTP